MRQSIAAAVLGLLAAPACAQPAPAVARGAPKLVIAISVDQLSADLFDEYRPHFTGGLARLARGTVFRNGYQAHAATETCPGHATILTGTHPANNGIIANAWWNLRAARKDKFVYCAEDERVTGSTSRNYTVSSVHLKVPALGDLVKRRWRASRSVAVAGKDRSAVMMGGHNPDQRWYWTSGRFETDLDSARVPASVTAANQAVAAMIAAAQPALQSPPLCSAKARPIAIGEGTIGTGRFERSAGDEPRFRTSPAFDGAVLALAASLVEELRLGRDSSPDVLAVGLAGTDYVGHRYGTAGQEMCLQLLSLDRDLGDFFRLLDSKRIDYAVVLTADHGGLDSIARLRQRLPSAAWADGSLDAELMGPAIAAHLGLTGPVLLGDDSGYIHNFYVAPGLPAADRARVQAEAVRRYRSHPQVEAVFTRQELSRTPIPTGSPNGWTLIQRARASFDPERSGDFVVVLHRNISPYSSRPGLAATHGSAWDYDRRVPIIFWRGGMAPANPDRAVATVDIMPTLAASLGLPLRRRVDGKCLVGVSGIACPR